MTIAVVRAPFRRSSNVKNLRRSSNVKNIRVVSELPHFCSIEESRGFHQSSHGGVQWGWGGAVHRRCVKWSRVLRHPSHYQTWICTTSRTRWWKASEDSVNFQLSNMPLMFSQKKKKHPSCVQIWPLHSIPFTDTGAVCYKCEWYKQR